MPESIKNSKDPQVFYDPEVGYYKVEEKYPRDIILERIQEIGEKIVEDNQNTTKGLTLVEIGVGSREFFKHLSEFLEERSYLDINRVYIPAKSYSGQEQRTVEIGDYELPEEGIDNRITILVDCVCDGKETLRTVSEEMDQYNPSRQDTAILFFKNDNEKIDPSIFTNEYIGFYADPKDWLVGFNVDFKELHREIDGQGMGVMVSTSG